MTESAVFVAYKWDSSSYFNIFLKFILLLFICSIWYYYYYYYHDELLLLLNYYYWIECDFEIEYIILIIIIIFIITDIIITYYITLIVQVTLLSLWHMMVLYTAVLAISFVIKPFKLEGSFAFSGV